MIAKVTDPLCEPYKKLLRVAIGAGDVAPSYKRQLLGSAVIERLMRSGDWAKLDLFYLFATENDAFSRRNWKDPQFFQASKVSTPTFTPGQGWNTPGATKYLNSTWNPTVHNVNFTINNHSFGAWVYNNVNDPGVLFGAQTTVSAQFGGVRLRNTNGVDGKIKYESASGEVGFPSVVAQNGMIQVNRTGASAGSVYKDASFQDSITTPTVHLPNSDLFICAQALNGSPANYLQSAIISSMFLGSGAVSPSVMYNAMFLYMANY